MYLVSFDYIVDLTVVLNESNVNLYYFLWINIFLGRLTTQQTRNGSYVSSIKTATLNEMPVPSGSWAEHNAAKQKSYNLHLVAGVAITIVTIFAVSYLFNRI